VAQIELALVDSAEQALRRGDPQMALDLASEHESSDETGQLVEEREVLAIDALARLGRWQEATARAARFLDRFPASTHRLRVERILERVRQGR
jgi:hypothetical protein